MRVPQIMETNARQFLGCKHADPFMRDTSRLQRAAINLRHHEGLAIGSYTDPQQFLCLP